VSLRIKLERAETHRLLVKRQGTGPFQQRLHACDQFARAERLADIIVNAKLKAQQTVVFFVALSGG
jgi:hypothetical protein